MSRRITLTLICDQCARIVSFETMSIGMRETIAKLDPYPKDWKPIESQGVKLDICPDCPIPVVETK